MYYVNKIVGWVTSPMGVLFIGLALGWALRAFTKLRRTGAWCIGLVLALTWIFGCGIMTRLVGVGLEADYSVPGRMHGDVGDLPSADAIVLLGGGIGVHEKCGGTELFSGADRVWTAAKLWKAGKAKLVTVSGGGAVGERTILCDFGLSADCVKIFSEARNTEEEAKLISALGVKKILLVTSAWHMPRARMLFEHAGFEVVPAPCDFEMNYAAEEDVKLRDFFPSAEVLMRNSWAIKEWVARFFYWVKFR